MTPDSNNTVGKASYGFQTNARTWAGERASTPANQNINNWNNPEDLSQTAHPFWRCSQIFSSIRPSSGLFNGIGASRTYGTCARRWRVQFRFGISTPQTIRTSLCRTAILGESGPGRVQALSSTRCNSRGRKFLSSAIWRPVWRERGGPRTHGRVLGRRPEEKV